MAQVTVKSDEKQMSFVIKDKGHMPAHFYWALVLLAMVLVFVAEAALFRANLSLLNTSVKSDFSDARDQVNSTFKGFGDLTQTLKAEAPKMPELRK